MQYLQITSLIALSFVLASCASVPQQQCPPGRLNLPDCPPANAIHDAQINKLHDSRTWQPADKLSIDPIKLGEQAKIPINHALTKILGPSRDGGLQSLATKIWLIENAQHTVDLTYYIFKRDKVGYAMLGALCNAVKRGVDVRIMVDSLGSFHATHSELKALESCAADAGFMRNTQGHLTTKKARVQAVVFNALSKLHFNRRSHDKLLVVDGEFPDTAAIITGGRNISLDYYGLKEDGSEDPTAFRDLEILLKPGLKSSNEEYTVGDVSQAYYTLLFLHKGNHRLRPVEEEDEDTGVVEFDSSYKYQLEKSQESLAFLKSQPEIHKRLQNMPHFMNKGFHDSQVRLSHQLSNLTSTNVTTEVAENLKQNPNSILYLIDKLVTDANETRSLGKTLRIVSPYLFSGKYYDDDDNVTYDGAKEIHQLLNDYPEARIEIVTNSVMTSDNFFAQAMIDMDMAPRMLLTPELQKAWGSGLEEGEFNPKIVESPEWKRLINNPRIFIYQTGKLDSVMLGHGKTHYGKLHAKYIVGEEVGFVGTSNFDYRSNLYNNEMGFFYKDNKLRDDLIKIFNELKATSYRWGSPEWLQMRKELMSSDSKKASPARKQRGIFKTMRGLGIEYLM
ncbi:MAG: phospholipase D-like domain-containing protein [Gammaproteobacteria bacterium]